MNVAHSGTPEDPRVLAAQLAGLRVQVSRKNPNEFCEYVVRNELPAAKGRKITQARVHEEMQRLFTNHPLIIMWSHVESGKTAQAIGRVLWELGPNRTYALPSAQARRHPSYHQGSHAL